MIHSDSTSAQTKRAQSPVRIRRAVVALLILVLTLALSGCGLFKDRTLTAVTIDDAAKIDINDLLKYEDLQQLDVRNAEITADVFDSLQSALPN